MRGRRDWADCQSPVVFLICYCTLTGSLGQVT